VTEKGTGDSSPAGQPERPDRDRRDRRRGIVTSTVGAAENVGLEALRQVERVGGEAFHAADKFSREPFWQAQAALIAVLTLCLTLPNELVIGPRWLMPTLELLLIGGLYLDRPRRDRSHARRERAIVIALLAIVAAANFVSLALLVHYLVNGGKTGGHQLLLSAVVIWSTNVVVFALWFWQLDRGGPDRRAQGGGGDIDFRFPQMEFESSAQWRPEFIDYLYVSFTNAAAFSPTDAMPLSKKAKMLMMIESIISIVTVICVAARAVNILG
jgi:uncharacterized membrane protein